MEIMKGFWVTEWRIGYAVPVVLSYSSSAVLVSCVMRYKAENTQVYCNSSPRPHGSDASLAPRDNDPQILKYAYKFTTVDPHHIIKCRNSIDISAIEDVIRIRFIRN